MMRKPIAIAIVGIAGTLALANATGNLSWAHDTDGSQPGTAASSSPSPEPSSSPSATPSASPSASPGTIAGNLQTFTSQLRPLNPQVNQGGVSGNARVVIQGDQIGIFAEGNNLFAGPHLAHIFKGARCPTPSDDTNRDGIIDVLEGVPAYGPILIRFDSDLSSFESGSEFAASANSRRNWTYIGSGSFGSLINDLRRPAPDASTGVGTLSDGENLDLSRAIVVVHGIDPNAQLPSSAQTLPGTTANQTLPVACGTLQLSNS